MSTSDQPSGRKRRETRELDIAGFDEKEYGNAQEPNEIAVYIGPNYVGAVFVHARHCDAVPCDTEVGSHAFMSAQHAETWLRMVVEDPEDAEDYAIVHAVHVRELH